MLFWVLLQLYIYTYMVVGALGRVLGYFRAYPGTNVVLIGSVGWEILVRGGSPIINALGGPSG